MCSGDALEAFNRSLSTNLYLRLVSKSRPGEAMAAAEGFAEEVVDAVKVEDG
jgi:hypothetical protein